VEHLRWGSTLAFDDSNVLSPNDVFGLYGCFASAAHTLKQPTTDR